MGADLRDANGRFLPGNKASQGAGRPRTDAAEKLRVSLEDVIGNGTLPKWKAAMKKRLEKGDQWATEFVFERIAGKVPAGLEISGAAGGPIEVALVDYRQGITEDEE